MKAGQHLASTKLPPLQLRFGVGFVVLVSVIYFFDTYGVIAALMPAVAVHELGHMAALYFLGAPPRRITASMAGLSMDYVGSLSPKGELSAALSGPIFGLAFAFLCAWCGRWLENDFLLLSAGLGCVLNLFNLLPVRPLDGGRALCALLELRLSPRTALRIVTVLGVLISLFMVGFGTYLFLEGRGFALVPAGVWLLFMQKNGLL